MNQEVYRKVDVFDKYIQKTYPEINFIKNLNFSIFSAVVLRGVEDMIDHALLPRSMKSGKNSKWIKDANFALRMTLGIDDMIYTKEGTLATVNNIMIPAQDLTLEKTSSA